MDTLKTMTRQQLDALLSLLPPAANMTVAELVTAIAAERAARQPATAARR